MKYRVSVSGVASVHRYITVEADDEEAAGQKAVRIARKDNAYPDDTKWELNGLLNCPEPVSTEIEANEVEEAEQAEKDDWK